MPRLATRRAFLALPFAVLIAVVGVAVANPVRADTAHVTIVDYQFEPITITVSAGTTVVWTNQGPSEHTSTSDNGVWDSGFLQAGQSFQFTFTKPGTFPYHCAIHPFMTGTVVVQPAPTSTATSTTLPTGTATVISVPSPTPPMPSPTETEQVKQGSGFLPTLGTATPTSTALPATPTLTATAAPVPSPTRAPIPLSAYPMLPARSATSAVRRVTMVKEPGGGYTFRPGLTKVKAGMRVMWRNGTGAVQSVTSATSVWKFDRTLPASGSVVAVFPRAGTYRYYSKRYTGARGAVVVTR